MQSRTLAFLDTGFTILLIVHCVEAGVTSVEYLIIVFGFELRLGVIALESRDPVSLVWVYGILLFLSPSLSLLLRVLDKFAIDPFLRSTLQNFLKVL